jgi:hypothetical protein
VTVTFPPTGSFRPGGAASKAEFCSHEGREGPENPSGRRWYQLRAWHRHRLALAAALTPALRACPCRGRPTDASHPAAAYGMPPACRTPTLPRTGLSRAGRGSPRHPRQGEGVKQRPPSLFLTPERGPLRSYRWRIGKTLPHFYPGEWQGGDEGRGRGQREQAAAVSAAERGGAGAVPGGIEGNREPEGGGGGDRGRAAADGPEARA